MFATGVSQLKLELQCCTSLYNAGNPEEVQRMSELW